MGILTNVKQIRKLLYLFFEFYFRESEKNLFYLLEFIFASEPKKKFCGHLVLQI